MTKKRVMLCAGAGSVDAGVLEYAQALETSLKISHSRSVRTWFDLVSVKTIPISWVSHEASCGSMKAEGRLSGIVIRDSTWVEYPVICSTSSKLRVTV
jgi:hypothetical protein